MAEKTATSRTVRGRAVKCGVSQHKIPDDIVIRALGGQLTRHVGPGWYAVVMFADCKGVAAAETDDCRTPSDDVASFMATVAAALNHHLHEDGHWIVAWTPNGGQDGEIVLLWRDGDGDPHAVVEVAAAGTDRLAALDLNAVLPNAEVALRLAAAQRAKLALSSRQIFMPVLGERLPSFG